MRDIERALCRGGGWLVSMQHFCLHDCAAFAIWHVLVIGGVVVALCTFCDALTSPVDTIAVTRIFVVWNYCGGCQASLHHACIIMHALHIMIGLCLYEKVRHAVQRE
jgi:hypothetical protein